MAATSARSLAFERPGGETCAPSKRRPVDLVHLSRQTLGDRAVEEEVLALFLQQATIVRERLARADTAERKLLAHGLKGSANGVGAFGVAACASEIETSPGAGEALKRLGEMIEEVRDFIASISR